MFSFKHRVLYGFALFAMFFGSGNLVFPLQVGVASNVYWFAGFIGLLCTGIVLPFLGLFVIKLYHGKYEDFFAQAGRFAQVVLPLFTLSLMSSFGVYPRCITVAYGGMMQLTTALSLPVFSLIFSILCYLVCLKDRTVVQVLGRWLSPLLLVSLAWMIFKGMLHAPAIMHDGTTALKACAAGFLIGYQTMDLFAAFFFSAFIFVRIQKSMPATSTTRDLFIAALGPSIIGVTLLAGIYVGLVYLGAHYAPLLQGVLPELMLPTVANYAIGNFGTVLIAATILFSCFTTAVALNNMYARYLCTVIKGAQNKFPLALVGTTAVAYFVSLLDFKGIAAFLAPILEVSYPSIIALTVMSIFSKGHKRVKMIVCYGILACMLYWRYML